MSVPPAGFNPHVPPTSPTGSATQARRPATDTMKQSDEPESGGICGVA